MRIAVVVTFSEQEHAAIAHELNDLRVGFKHAEAGEVFDLWREPSRVIHRAIDFQSVSFADHKIVVAVTRSSVH